MGCIVHSSKSMISSRNRSSQLLVSSPVVSPAMRLLRTLVCCEDAVSTWSVKVAALSDVQHLAAHGEAERQRRVAAAVPHQARQRDVADLPRPASTTTGCAVHESRQDVCSARKATSQGISGCTSVARHIV